MQGAEWKLDDESRAEGSDRIRNAPAPVGYDPSIIPGWDSPTALAFGILEVVPWRLRVMPVSYMVAARACCSHGRAPQAPERTGEPDVGEVRRGARRVTPLVAAIEPTAYQPRASRHSVARSIT